jgi:hypothetical protein
MISGDSSRSFKCVPFEKVRFGRRAERSQAGGTRQLIIRYYWTTKPLVVSIIGAATVCGHLLTFSLGLMWSWLVTEVHARQAV